MKYFRKLRKSKIRIRRDVGIVIFRYGFLNNCDYFIIYDLLFKIIYIKSKFLYLIKLLRN